MNSCNLTITEEVQMVQLVVSILTFFPGLVSNVVVLAIFCYRRREAWSYMMVYIANLALADCTVLFALPFKVYSHWEEWPFSTEACKLLVSVYYINMYVSIFTATAISMVRYVGIKYPFRAKEIMSPRKAIIVCALIWLLICCLSAAFHNVDAPAAGNNTTQFKCFQKNKSEPLPFYFIMALELGYFLPLVTMIFCSVQIIRTLSKKTEVSSQSDKIQCIRIIVANLTVFVICFSPYHFGFLFKFIIENKESVNCGLLQGVHSFIHISICIANTNCFLDAFTYYFVTKDSRKRLITCCHSKAGSSENAVI